MLPDEILEPIFIIPGKGSELHEILVPFRFNTQYGVVSLPAYRSAEVIEFNDDKRRWAFRLTNSRGGGRANITPGLDLAQGLIKTPDPWRPYCEVCSRHQRPLILKWVAQMNLNVRNRK